VTQLFADRLPPVESSAARGEVRYVAPAGREKTFGILATPLIVPERRLLGYLYTFNDLTEVRRLEREVRMRDRLAALGRMAEGIAHEIRQPLSSIAGSVKVLSTIAALTDEQHKLAEIVGRESVRLNGIISDFLAYAREKNYTFAECDLRLLLEDTLMLLENRLPVLGNERAAQSAPIQIVRRFDASGTFARTRCAPCRKAARSPLPSSPPAIAGKFVLPIPVPDSHRSRWRRRSSRTSHGLRVARDSGWPSSTRSCRRMTARLRCGPTPDAARSSASN